MKTQAKRRVFWISAITAGLMVIFFMQYLVDKLVSIDRITDAELMRYADEINRTCPFYVDNETRLDNTLTLPGKVIGYNYTLVNLEDDFVNTAEMEAIMKPRIINMIKSSDYMRFLRNNNVTFHYNYKNVSGVYVLKIVITPAEYNADDQPEEIPTGTM